MQIEVLQDYKMLSEWAARFVVERINEATATSEKPFVLGLPTGSTPLGVYENLIEFYKGGKVSFKNVVTFNMDEYLGLNQDHPQSYYCFMHKHFFNHIDIDSKNVHILNGTAKSTDEECSHYEQAITKVGGIDLFIGGIGHNGHLAFNEPGSDFRSRTRVVQLSERSRVANSRFFDNDTNKVPLEALTVGIATVLDAQEVLVLASGLGKANAVEKAVNGPVSEEWPITSILTHNNVTVACDKHAASNL